MNQSKILTIQSQVAYGYVGNNAAELAIQLHGIDAICLPTVILSSHTGFNPVYGQAVTPELFADLLRGIDAIHVAKDLLHVVSGYYRTKEIIALSKNYIVALKNKQQCTYICDPVMGDNGALYVSEEIASAIIHELIPVSDIITPNHFEMEYILQDQYNTPTALVQRIQTDSVLSKKTVIVTNTHFPDTPKDKVETVIIAQGQYKRILSSYVDAHYYGTGDLFTGLLASRIAIGCTIEEAVTYCVHFISDLITYLSANHYTELNAKGLVTCFLNSK